MLNESIKKLVQYGINTGITPESERIYTTNLLLDVMKEDDFEDVDCDLDNIVLEDVLADLLDGLLDRLERELGQHVALDRGVDAALEGVQRLAEVLGHTDVDGLLLSLDVGQQGSALVGDRVGLFVHASFSPPALANASAISRNPAGCLAVSLMSAFMCITVDLRMEAMMVSLNFWPASSGDRKSVV